jgi:hypothetical protein
MIISSRTPEGRRNHCAVCGSDLKIEPSDPTGDAPCPRCGHLLWFTSEKLGDVNVVAPASRLVRPESSNRLSDAVAWREVDLGRSSGDAGVTMGHLQSSNRLSRFALLTMLWGSSLFAFFGLVFTRDLSLPDVFGVTIVMTYVATGIALLVSLFMRHPARPLRKLTDQRTGRNDLWDKEIDG